MRNWINISSGMFISEGAKEKALPMLSLVPDETIKKNEKLINAVIDLFKGNTSRLTWAMKILRLNLVSNHPNQDEVVDAINKYSDGIELEQLDLSVVNTFKHYYNLPIPEIKNYQYTNKTIDDVLSDFSVLEEEFKKAADQEVELLGNEDIIMDFKDGFVWMNLNRGGCTQEAKAMGHCGNGAGRGDETILSLRKHIRGNIYRPSLTFVLEDGYLTEMKGRQNDKPHRKYHKYIIPLLKHDIIEGIKGGGYLPQNNFSLYDLDENARNSLLKIKPSLTTLEEMVRIFLSSSEENEKNYMKPKIEKLIGDDVWDIKWDGNNTMIQFLEEEELEDLATELFDDIFTRDRLEELIEEECEKHNEHSEKKTSATEIQKYYDNLLLDAYQDIISIVNFEHSETRFVEIRKGYYAPCINLKDTFSYDHDYQFDNSAGQIDADSTYDSLSNITEYHNTDNIILILLSKYQEMYNHSEEKAHEAVVIDLVKKYVSGNAFFNHPDQYDFDFDKDKKSY